MMTRAHVAKGRARAAAVTGLVVIALVGPASRELAAQSTLSVQGFGFPTGQFSSRTYGAGGALAEMDPLTPVNPATIAVFPTRLLFFQMEPEYRSTSTANGTERTTTARYPVVFGALPVGYGWVVSLSSSTLLDRTSTTSFKTAQFLAPSDSVPMTTTYQIDGAMDDVRLAAAWSPVTWIRLGLGAHAITGHNRVTVTQSFVDSVRFAAFTAQRILSFSGGALSGGVQLVWPQLVASASARWGGSLRMSVEDTSLSSARVPNHFGASIAYTGITNSAIAIRTSHEDWSALNGLGTTTSRGVDAWDSSIGADIAGPRFGNRIVFLRGGFRHRTLPFQADDQTVTENSITGGVGTTFAQGRVLTDVALIHAARSIQVGASESAWTISFGISIRP